MTHRDPYVGRAGCDAQLLALCALWRCSMMGAIYTLLERYGDGRRMAEHVAAEYAASLPALQRLDDAHAMNNAGRGGAT